MSATRRPSSSYGKRWPVIAIAAVLTVTLVGCGGGGGGGSSSGSSGSSSGATSSKYLQATTAVVDKLLGTQGTYQPPPSSSPPPAKNKNVWLISCGQSISACSVPIGAAAQAAQKLGWKTHIFDTKADYSQAGRGIRSAIVDKADGIFVYFIDCKYMRRPLEEAKAAGIPVVPAESLDCNESNSSAPKLFPFTVTYSGGITGPYPKPVVYAKYVYDWGRAQAMYAISKLNGKANIIVFNEDTTTGAQLVEKAYRDEFARCAGCKIQVVKFPYAELATTIRPRVEQALLKNPNANAVAGTYEAVTLAGVAEGASRSGRKLLVMNGEGVTAAGMDNIRSGKATAGNGERLDWEAFSAIDALNRIFNHAQPLGSGIGMQLYDKAHNTPASGPFEPPYDFVSLYYKAWGVG
jgi:ribose transport system substrate-binding protein